MRQQLVRRRLVLLLMAQALRIHEAETRVQDMLVHSAEKAHRMRMRLIETVVRVNQR